MLMKWNIKRGDIILCDLGIRNGSVQEGIRPCVVVSNNIGNTYSTIYIVVPSTSKVKPNLPTHVYIHSDNISCVLCEQCTTVSDQQVLRKVGKVSDYELEEITKALKVALKL